MFAQARNAWFSTRFRHLSRFLLFLALLVSSLGPTPQAHAAALAFTSGLPSSGSYGTLYLHTFTTNSVATFSVSSGALPLGLALAPTGTLTGIPLQSGQFALTVKAQSLLESATQSFTLTISKRALTITADNQTMTYGGTVPNLTYVATGLISGDTLTSAVTGAPATSATSSSPAGSYAITQGTLSALNYLISFVPGTLTIAKATLTATADNFTRTINTANPAFTIHYSGFVNGDTAAGLGTLPSASTTATLNSPAGSYPIALSGGSDTNYLFNLVNGVLTVSNLSVPEIVWNTPASITYGQALGAGQLNATATFGGQAVSGTFTYDPPAGTVLEAGSGQALRVTFTPLNTALYAIVSGQVLLNVARAPLTITADNQTMTYGDSVPALTVSTSGLVNGDTFAAAVTGAPATSATSSSPAGSYTISQGTLSALNYLISFVEGTLTVGKATLTATADSLTRTINTANPAFTIHYSGFVNGDTAAGLGTLPSASTTATLNSPAGSYPIALSGGSDMNYLFNLVNGVLTVSNLSVPHIVWNDPAPITYGQALGAGQLNATATFGGQSVSGTFTYDPPAGTVLEAGSGQALRVTFTPLNTALYAIVTGQTQISISRAALTITAANQTITYGGTLPDLTYTGSGLVNGDTLAFAVSGALATSATVTSPAGSYTISQGTLSSANYLLGFVPGILNIGKAPLTAAAADLTRLLNTANPPLTIHYSGLVNGDTEAVLDTPPSASTTATLNSPAGSYPIALSGGTDGNYSLTLLNGTLKITSKNVPQIVWNNPATITYGDALSATQLNATATFGGQPVSGSFAYDPPAGRVLNAGAGQVLHTTFTPQNSSSYETVSGQVQINVARAPLTIAADNGTMIQGHAAPKLTARYTGFVNGDTASALDRPVALRTSATPQSAPGTYPIVPSNASDANYTISFANGTLKNLWGMYLAVARR